MNRKIKVIDGQSIWDIAVQEYGSVEGVKQLIIDNPLICNFETNLPAGALIIITEPPINSRVTEYCASKNINPATAIDEPYISNWILATGLWNNSGFWYNNALWIN